MFGKMISRGARSNLKKSMVKLHKAKFGSPVHRQSVQEVALNLELICKHWDHHPSSPLLPSQEVIVDFAEYICSDEYESSDRQLLAIAGTNLKDKELENFMTIILFLFEKNQEDKSHERYLQDKKNISDFACDIYTQLKNPNFQASSAMRSAVKEIVKRIIMTD